MVHDQLHLNMLATEVGKIATRITRLRHVTYRLVQPEVISQLEDRGDLCASLHSLNQLIDSYEEQLSNLSEAIAALRLRHYALSVEGRTGLAIAEETLAGQWRQVATEAANLRLQMNTTLISADAILHLFTEETSQ